MTVSSTTTSATAVRFGLLGAGRVARDFATGLAVVEGAALAAVASRSNATVDAFVVQFPGTRVHAGYASLLEDPDIDVVYVATPHHLHAEQTIAGLEAGKAVLCEKPFALDATEARAVADVARREGRFCMEAMWMRFFPTIRRAVELVQAGAIGEPRLLHADFGVPTAGGPESRFFDPEQGGGALLDRGVYAVSLATMLFGAPVSVAAEAGRTPTGVDGHIGMLLRFSGGEVAVLSSSLTSMTTNAALISGTEGSLTIEQPFYCPERLTVRHFSAGNPDAPPSRKDQLVSTAKRTRPGRAALRIVKPLIAGRPQRVHNAIAGNGYGYEAEEVVRCLRAGELESPLMRLDDSIMVMEVLDRLQAAAQG